MRNDLVLGNPTAFSSCEREKGFWEQAHAPSSGKILLSPKSNAVNYFGQGWPSHRHRQQLVPALDAQKYTERAFAFVHGAPISNVCLSTRSEKMPDAVLMVGGERHVKSSFAMNRLATRD
jgi:hypothetical protein